MQWLANNYLWLLAVAIIPALGFLLKRYVFTEPAGSSLTARDSEVSGSPVISGSGNVTHIYGQPPITTATPVPTTTVPLPYTQPRPNMKQTNVRIFPVNEYGLPSRFTEDRTGKAYAVVIEFTNEAIRDQVNVGATVKASLVFENNHVGVLRSIGSWLRSEFDVTQFDVEDTHHLVVGFFHNQRFQTSDMRTAGGYVHPEVHLVPTFQTVRVRLTDASMGDIFYEGRFRVTLDPLAIVPEIGQGNVVPPRST